ncbi:MAG: hypothetical protein HQK96_20635 [Nitrospirae bacterium]|nr:hypothetical protein [Nitrospirota bacterium]
MEPYECDSVRFNLWMPRWMHKGMVNFAVRDGRDAADIMRQLISEWILYKKSGIQYRGFSDKLIDLKKEE